MSKARAVSAKMKRSTSEIDGRMSIWIADQQQRCGRAALGLKRSVFIPRVRGACVSFDVRGARTRHRTQDCGRKFDTRKSGGNRPVVNGGRLKEASGP